MLKNLMLKTNPYCLSQNHYEFVKTEPSRSDNTICVTATNTVRFFNPMDARWCCPSTVFSFLLHLCSCYFLITLYFYCQPDDQ